MSAGRIRGGYCTLHWSGKEIVKGCSEGVGERCGIGTGNAKSPGSSRPWLLAVTSELSISPVPAAAARPKKPRRDSGANTLLAREFLFMFLPPTLFLLRGRSQS